MIKLWVRTTMKERKLDLRFLVILSDILNRLSILKGCWQKRCEFFLNTDYMNTKNLKMLDLDAHS